MSDTFVLVEQRDGVAIVTLNRPERRNGLSAGLCNALHASLVEIAETPARVLVLRGAGRDFCVGADLSAAAAEGLCDPRIAPFDAASNDRFDRWRLCGRWSWLGQCL